MKKVLVILLSLVLTLSFGMPSFAENGIYTKAEDGSETFDVDADSAVLMEAQTGMIMYSKNPNASYPPASVTKIMTLLLVAEVIADGSISLGDNVSISEHASSMGGSQVFLKEGEKMNVEELIKCTVIASANDAAVALAEYVAGSEDAFVRRMNAMAMELGLKSTNFENVTGLDDTTVNHVTSALDIAIMSKQLLKHDIILKYSSLWQDSIRDGEFTLTNTNRLVRFYDGCNGLKTGSTDKAGFCMSATAKRGGMQLIAVVMGAEGRDIRNSIATRLLDYGFSTYALFEKEESFIEEIPVYFGSNRGADIYSEDFSMIVKKSDIKNIKEIYEIPNNVCAPLKNGDAVGKITFVLNEETIGECNIIIKEDIEKITFLKLFATFILSVFDNI